MLQRIVVPGIVAVLLATGCGSDESTATAETTTPPTTTTVDDPPPSSTAAESDVQPTKPEVVVPDGPAPKTLEIDDIIVGDGKTAAPGDLLTMHYVGVRHADGGEFDASWNRESTFSFTLGSGQVIQGWDQGIEGMREGGRRLLSIPADLAYGSTARGDDIPADSALVFVVDLVQVLTPPVVENAPEPVTELQIEILEEGTGPEIAAGMLVELHYQAVLQSTGEVFASSWGSGQPAAFVVAAQPSQSIPAWDMGLVGKRVGDTIRMVIPPDLGIDDTTGQIPEDATIVTVLTILGVS